ncbi:MAG: class I SAM-dependent methyltransferase [Anaerolineales bacterium]|nr:class I SAM-dependent methyltransferase [Chloroflexota bacterium]MBL6980866.1 class I SAM-dependent methyltransferase [Anaerolineales bacterium]
MSTLEKYLEKALEARSMMQDFQSASQDFGSLRLYSGFYEGYPDLVVDIYGKTLVLFNYGESRVVLDAAQSYVLEKLPWVNCVIHKTRSARDPVQRSGVLAIGDSPTEKIQEHGVWYALDLQMQQDASFYFDTRILRKWLLENAHDWKVLNTFAYTGSLGVAALAGGAAYVMQTDLKRNFLEQARRSAMLNRLDLGKMKLKANDFFSIVGQLKRKGELFDCLIIDPPFFSSTKKGSVDLVNESTRLINKVRPLVADGGYLVAINNALFLSGAEYMRSLEELCKDGYLSIETTIPIPPDITGFSSTIVGLPPTDPAPFNHPTKIAILRVRRKK